MNKVHQSKVDTWLAIVLVATPIPLVFVIWRLFHVSTPGRWFISLLIILVGICLPISLLTTTKYTITDISLFIRSGIFKWEIPLKDISTIEPSNDPESGPALSLDRLRIDYGQGKSILISPANKAEFIRDLKALNVPSA